MWWFGVQAGGAGASLTSNQGCPPNSAPLTRPNMAATPTGVGDTTIFSPVSGAKNKDPQTLILQQKWRKLHYNKEHSGPSHRNIWKASLEAGKYLGQSASYLGQCTRQPAQPAGHRGWAVRQPGPLTSWLPNPEIHQANTKHPNITKGHLIRAVVRSNNSIHPKLGQDINDQIIYRYRHVLYVLQTSLHRLCQISLHKVLGRWGSLCGVFRQCPSAVPAGVAVSTVRRIQIQVD